MMNKIIVGALGLVARVAATPVELIERNSCRDDSLFKCFASREYSQSATAYCEALDPSIRTVTAAVPVATKTVVITSTGPAVTDFISSTTTIYTVTVASATEIATETDNETAIATAVETETETATETQTETALQTTDGVVIETVAQTTTQTVTATVTVTSGQAPTTTTQAPVVTLGSVQTKAPAKRNGRPQPPKCMITKCFVYSPERITAACDCIGVPPETITITQAGASSTITVTSTSATTPHVTATTWQTVGAALSDGVATDTAIVTNVMTNTITNVVTNTVTKTVTKTVTSTVTNAETITITTPLTVTATATTTTTVTPTPTLGPNLVTNGDFTGNSFTPWTVTMTGAAGTWISFGANSINTPDEKSALHVINARVGPPLIITSAPFSLVVQSVYDWSLKVATTSTDNSWLQNTEVSVVCGSVTVFTKDFSAATGSPGGYYTASGRPSTPITTQPDIISALTSCRFSVSLASTSNLPSTFWMTGASIQYEGPITF